jgi:DoxX-like family
VTDFWITTALLAFGIGGGAAEPAQLPNNVEGMVHLGYPVYFVTIIGFSKILGAVALPTPGLPRLRDGSNGAQAGHFLPLTGAAASHLLSGNGFCPVAVTLGLASFTVVPGALRPQNRTVGVLLPPPEKSCIVKGAGVEHNQAVP